ASVRGRGGPDAWPPRSGAGVARDPARTADADDTGLERAAAGALHAVADTDTEVTALGARLSLPCSEVAVADGLHGALLTTMKIAAVERDAGARARPERGGVGHLVCWHEVPTPHVRAVDGKRIGDSVEHALHRECALGIAGAAHRHGGDLVGLNDLHIKFIGR